AQGYRNLLTIDGYDPKQIAERVGKSESYVYDRLKLLQLIPAFQELFFAHRFSLGHAILLARVGASVQQELLEDEDGGGGFWRRDFGHATLGLLNPDQEEGPYAGSRPVSVRELQAWIDNHVRFDASDEAVPQLFAATAQTLAAAEAEKAKVIDITYSFHVHPDAKDADGGRTYGPQSWKRADGEPGSPQFGETEKPSKTCEYSVVGLVAAGEHRGESFLVCIDTKRCTVHWGEEIKARNKREREKEKGEASTSSKAAPKDQSWEREQRLRDERVKLAKERWEKGGAAVIRAIVPQVKKLAVGGTSAATEYFLYGMRDGGKNAAKLGIPRGATAADLIRHVILVSLLERAEPDNHQASNEKDLQEDLDALKIKVNVAK
ncbi:MAG: ParB/RepB/Spo0J family partition protein, partial [Myxococcota bacterium]